MKQIKNITIVGGGSAAWLAATYIQHNHWDIPITVIDKEHGNPIGVGEATVLTFPSFLRKCGINLPQWFANIDATYKSGIEFPHWKKPGNNVWHPFYLNRSYFRQGCTAYDTWATRQDLDFKNTALPTYEVNMNNKLDMWGAFETIAYHIDAGKLVKELQRVCTNTVKIIKSDVVKVNKDGKNVTSVELKNGIVHESDFFIDCTGFASILKEADRVELLGEGRLFTNAAVAGHVPYEDFEKECVPYVKCPAVDHGWIWKIPVQSRIGSGLVFNKDITDPEEAKRYFCEHWDNRIKPEDLKLIDWVPYYSKNFWEGNVVSIGLSGGFIEPLESTGLASMTTGVEKLMDIIPQYAYNEANIETYNREMEVWYNDAVDFVNSHYADTEWDTPFWNYVKETHVKSEKHLWYENWLKDPQRKFYTPVQSRTLFHPPNWHLWLIQMGYPVNVDLNYMPPQEIDFLIQDFKLAEEIRMHTSLKHTSAIESTNLGLDWLQLAHARGDRGQLV
jgi:tryptophan halogenase